jgi:hypothetical protein
MLVHIGNSVGATSPERIGDMSNRFMMALNARMLAGLDRKLAQIAAKRTPAVAKPTAKTAAAKPKPVSRGARLRQAESEVQAAKPRDRRLCWSDMQTD